MPVIESVDAVGVSSGLVGSLDDDQAPRRNGGLLWRSLTSTGRWTMRGLRLAVAVVVLAAVGTARAQAEPAPSVGTACTADMTWTWQYMASPGVGTFSVDGAGTCVDGNGASWQLDLHTVPGIVRSNYSSCVYFEAMPQITMGFTTADGARVELVKTWKLDDNISKPSYTVRVLPWLAGEYSLHDDPYLKDPASGSAVTVADPTRPPTCPQLTLYPVPGTYTYPTKAVIHLDAVPA